MATRNIVPRANEEGGIGTFLKNWLKGWFKDIYISNTITDGTNSAIVADIKEAVDKKHPPSQLGTKQIDESGIGNGKAITYNLGGDKLEYTSAGSGDMAKVVYDINNVGRVDNSEALNDGTYSKTAQEVEQHIDSTSNPHSVTKAQVSLTSVTNDSQLKRAAGDIATFIEKTLPVGADLVLIEDSADSNNKKKVKIGNLPYTKEVFFLADFSGNLGTSMRERAIGASGSFNFNFSVPDDLSNIISMVMVAVLDAGTNISGQDIDLISTYGAVGESYNNHSEINTTILYDFSIYSVNDVVEYDISSVFVNLAAGDRGGINIDHKGIGGTINYLGIKIKYS